MSAGLLNAPVFKTPMASSLWYRTLRFRFRDAYDLRKQAKESAMEGEVGAQKFLRRMREPMRHGGHVVRMYRCEKELRQAFLYVGFPDVGQASGELSPAIDDEKFIDIAIDNFDERIKAMKPRSEATQGSVFGRPMQSTLVNDDRLAADMANKVDILRELLDIRMQLNQLQRYADGENGAEELMLQLSNDKALLNFLVRMGKKYAEDQCIDVSLNLHDVQCKE